MLRSKDLKIRSSVIGNKKWYNIKLMLKQNMEIEIRGKLSKSKFAELLNNLKSEGKLIDNYKRLSVDLSPGFDPRTKTWKRSSEFDLRIKKSGDSEKISVKVGQFHQKERREVEVPLKQGSFLDAISLFEILGYDRGMIYFWESWEFRYKDYEIKLSKYNSNYYTWEIESRSNNKDPEMLASELGLKAYTKDEYNQAINWENQHIHERYSYQLAKNKLKSF